MSHKKFGPDRFSRFDVYWIQTNKQTDKPNLYIDIVETNLYIMPNPTYLSLLPISEVVQVDLYFIEINKNIG